MAHVDDHPDEMAQLEADYDAESKKVQAATSKEWIELEGLGQDGPDASEPVVVEAPKADAKPKTELVPQPKAAPIAFDERGLMTGSNAAEEIRIARWFLATGACPDSYKTAEQVVLGIQLLKSFGLNVLASIRFTGYINGVLYVWGDLPKAIVLNSGQMDSMQEDLYAIDDNNKMIKRCLENGNLHLPVAVAVCHVKRKGDERTYEFSFSTEEAMHAGLLPGKGMSAWSKYPRRMLQLRARAQALKDIFPDVLTAVRIKEYDLEESAEHYDAKLTKGGVAGEINELYGKSDAEI